MELLRKLGRLRVALAQAAQGVLDEWQQDEGTDEELGTGGVCDRVSQAMSAVIEENIDDVITTEGGQPGDDHAFFIAYDANEAYAIDIPPDVYETGGGYQWRKIADVVVKPSDVVFVEVDRDLVVDWDD